MSASPRECAGSVLKTSVRKPESANWMAKAALVLVFPTPPLPPTRMYFGPNLSISLLNEESGAVNFSLALMVGLRELHVWKVVNLDRNGSPFQTAKFVRETFIPETAKLETGSES
mmetsp:Transcript_34182/g.90310  ORF Transcript_34182/g.90310 Transcript_34182/m.90310 type:complete len:115 (-) Transcript_34182:44-388(-)